MLAKSSMYHLEKVVKLPEVIDLTKCMYHLKPAMGLIHVDPDLSPGICSSSESYSEVLGKTEGLSALEARQEAVLHRLQELKRRLDHLQNNKFSTSRNVDTTGTANTDSVKKGGVHDLVISARPSNPPFSLVLLRKLLNQAELPVYSVSHLHSTVTEVTPFLHNSFTDKNKGDRLTYPLAFTLHWKDVSETSLMINPLSQCTINGESNIIRYISRLFPSVSPYNYEAVGSFVAIAETDTILDQIQNQLVKGNNREQQAVIRQLNARLGKSQWVNGDECGIVDIWAWSAILQTKLNSSLPNNVGQWYKNMEAMAGMKVPEETSNGESNENQQTKGASVVGNSRNAKGDKAKQGSKITEVQGDNKGEKSQLKTNQGQQNGTDQVTLLNGIGSSSSENYVDRAGLEHYLKQIGINYKVCDHEAVFTVEALMKNVTHMEGLHMKNLFLKDKKKNFYLLAARHNAEVKLNEIAKKIEVKDLRFGDETTMFDLLGVRQGCVTVFALINDKEKQVKLILDSEALNKAHPFVNFHPMSNAATLGVSPSDLEKFLTSVEHEPTILNLS